MPKTTGERNSTQITASILLDDRAFIEELLKARNHASIGDTFRDIFQQLRTCFSLPPFMADRIRKDMKDRDLDIIAYTQDLFGRRFQELEQQDREGGSRTKTAKR